MPDPKDPRPHQSDRASGDEASECSATSTGSRREETIAKIRRQMEEAAMKKAARLGSSGAEPTDVASTRKPEKRRKEKAAVPRAVRFDLPAPSEQWATDTAAVNRGVSFWGVVRRRREAAPPRRASSGMPHALPAAPDNHTDGRSGTNLDVHSDLDSLPDRDDGPGLATAQATPQSASMAAEPGERDLLAVVWSVLTTAMTGILWACVKFPGHAKTVYSFACTLWPHLSALASAGGSGLTVTWASMLCGWVPMAASSIDKRKLSEAISRVLPAIASLASGQGLVVYAGWALGGVSLLGLLGAGVHYGAPAAVSYGADAVSYGSSAISYTSSALYNGSGTFYCRLARQHSLPSWLTCADLDTTGPEDVPVAANDTSRIVQPKVMIRDSILAGLVDSVSAELRHMRSDTADVHVARWVQNGDTLEMAGLIQEAHRTLLEATDSLADYAKSIVDAQRQLLHVLAILDKFPPSEHPVNTFLEAFKVWMGGGANPQKMLLMMLGQVRSALETAEAAHLRLEGVLPGVSPIEDAVTKNDEARAKFCSWVNKEVSRSVTSAVGKLNKAEERSRQAGRRGRRGSKDRNVEDKATKEKQVAHQRYWTASLIATGSGFACERLATHGEALTSAVARIKFYNETDIPDLIGQVNTVTLKLGSWGWIVQQSEISEVEWSVKDIATAYLDAVREERG